MLVAMRNPRDVIALDDLRILTGYEITTVVIPDRELDAAIKQFENASMGVETHADDEQPEEPDGEAIEAGKMAEQPAVQLANQIFNQSIKAGASDVHIEPRRKTPHQVQDRRRARVMNLPKLQASLFRVLR